MGGQPFKACEAQFGSRTHAEIRFVRQNKKAAGFTRNCGLDWGRFGAGKRSRTPDLLITNELLYQLSYSGEDRYYSERLIVAFAVIAGYAFNFIF